MQLGAFSLSLSVKDLSASREFYEKLGFSVFAGSLDQQYLIMKNASALIGLFQGMFEGNLITFNPGWNADASPLAAFDDVRDIQTTLQRQNIEIANPADTEGTGPASFLLTDPDGNVILIDQHVNRPTSAG
ncbi:VOC family protein [Neolewinella aquimaris]